MSAGTKKAPWWFVVVIIIAALPVFFVLPVASTVLGNYFGGENAIVGWFFPIYVILSGICSYLCYPERREVAWILVVLMFLAAIMLFFCN